MSVKSERTAAVAEEIIRYRAMGDVTLEQQARTTMREGIACGVLAPASETAEIVALRGGPRLDALISARAEREILALHAGIQSARR